MLSCHSCQNYVAWRSKEVGKDFKVIIFETNHKGGGTNFYRRVDPSKHYDLVYGSRLIINQANSLLYEQLILSVRICKVLFKNWRFQIKIVECIISYKHVNAFVSRTLTVYCFAIELKLIF